MTGTITEYNAKRLLHGGNGSVYKELQNIFVSSADMSLPLKSSCSGLVSEDQEPHTLLLHFQEFLSVTDLNTLNSCEYPWLRTKKLVVKPDILLKRRGVSGLVKLNVPFEEARDHIESNLMKEVSVGGCSGPINRFIVEPFYDHDELNEFYISFRTSRDFDNILFNYRGGVGLNFSESTSLNVSILSDGSQPSLKLDSLLYEIHDTVMRERLEVFICFLYRKFFKMNFIFLELNPFCFDKDTGKFVILDAAGRLDSASHYLCEDMWGSEIDFPNPFGRIAQLPEEKYIKELDSKTGSSLKLTILNPNGRIWLMVAGGGASVVYADTICEFGYLNELANYGEYSGAPNENLTYEYARTIVSLITRDNTERENGKILLIGGGIANFTNVADTFRGIIRVLKEYRDKLLRFNVRIYVRRGGPNYQDGLKVMREAASQLGLFVKVFGPEAYITEIICIALKDDLMISGRKLICNVNESLNIWTDKTGIELDKKCIDTGEENNLCEAFSLVGKGLTSTVRDIIEGAVSKYLTCLKEEKGSRDNSVSITVNLFDKSRCFIWGLQSRAVQEMLDFDHVCGKKKASVAAIIYEFSVSHLRPFYFGTEEIFIPVCQTLKEAVLQFPDVDILINFASLRSAYKVTMGAMEFSNIKKIAIVAEGVPERRTRELIVMAKEKGVTLIGPATVGGLVSGQFRIGNTGGSLENIMNSKLYRPGSVGFVTKSGGMLNEINNILSTETDGTCEGIAIGGDRFPGTTFLDHLLRFEKNDKIKMVAVLGELGGILEYEIVEALKKNLITKPMVCWCVGTCASLFTSDVPFGHAGAWVTNQSEYAVDKNNALKLAGAIVPNSFHDFGRCIKYLFNELVKQKVINTTDIEPEIPRVPMDYLWAKSLGLVRKPKGFITTISDDRGEEVVYAGWPISKVIKDNMGIGGVVSLLWFKRPIPEYCYKYIETILMLTADHGPAVCGAHNTIVTARAGKDLISCLAAGLLTIGDRFGGACDMAAQQFMNALENSETPDQFVHRMRHENNLIMGIGHKIKNVRNPDMRVQLLKKFCFDHFPKTEHIQYALDVEAITTKKKDTLILNVDGLIGVSMCDLLFSCGAFTEDEAKDYIHCGCINGLFVLGRSIGFIGHFLDQRRLKQGLYRHDVDDIAYVLPDLVNRD